MAGKQELFGDPRPAIPTRIDLSSGKVPQYLVEALPVSAVVGGLPMGVVADGFVLASGRNGTAVAYSADNGKRLWSRNLRLKLREDSQNLTLQGLPSAAAVNLGSRVAYYLDPSGQLVGLDLDSGAVRWRGRVQVPKSPIEAGVAPKLMVYDHRLIGLTGGELFYIKPVLPKAGS